MKTPEEKRLWHNARTKRWRDQNRDKRRIIDHNSHRKQWTKLRSDPNRVQVYRDKVRPIARRNMNIYRRRVRRMAFEHYGLACVCCGEDRDQFLSMDHINGDGGEHRRTLKGQGVTNIFQWLKAHNYPPGFQTLCFNCNLARGFSGLCHDHESFNEACAC